LLNDDSSLSTINLSGIRAVHLDTSSPPSECVFAEWGKAR
jgi:hypothetical protein